MTDSPNTTDELSLDERVANDLPVTRAEAEAHIRGRPKFCRGPHLAATGVVLGALTAAVQRDRAIKAAYEAALEDEREALREPIAGPDHDHAWFNDKLATHLGTLSTREAQQHLYNIDQPHAAAIVDEVARQRGCGADFNDIVISGPLDGQQHAYTCPKCGVEGRYIAPRFTIADSDAA